MDICHQSPVLNMFIVPQVLALRWRLLQCFERMPLALVTSDLETRRCWTKACVEHLESSSGFLSSLHVSLIPPSEELDEAILQDPSLAPVMTATLDILEVHRLEGRHNMESLVHKVSSISSLSFSHTLSSLSVTLEALSLSLSLSCKHW